MSLSAKRVAEIQALPGGLKNINFLAGEAMKKKKVKFINCTIGDVF